MKNLTTSVLNNISIGQIIDDMRLFVHFLMTYTEWKAIAKKNKLTVSAISDTAGYSRDSIQRACERNDGEVPERFVLILEAVIHRKNRLFEGLKALKSGETHD